VTTSACNSTTAYAAADRVNYLSGDRSCEISSVNVGLFRHRSSVLGDVMDSSPTWVGVPDAPYPAVWKDRINAADTLSENQASSSNTYPAFVSANLNRTQVVYVGANDGLVHGFRSGFFNLANTACTSTSPPATCFTNNDGMEQIAYMPGQVVNSIHSTTANVDYSNSQYGHNYFVDATPYAGDLYFNGQWHTWLVGGLGPGGPAIYALDITNPGTTTASGSVPGTGANAFLNSGQPNASVVVGEWNNTSISCVANSSCGTSLGNTYGTPQIRRLHDGNWGIIFGNGFGSASGDAGIYVGVVNPNSGALTFYYLSTNTGGTSNGIAFVTPVDLDGDHITDYVYAGDLNGNVWRFDLTSASETTWASSAPFKLFTTSSGQPITTAVSVASGAAGSNMQQQLMVIFGTGQRIPVTNTSGAIYASAQQALYGVWDWNMSAWNTLNSAAQYATLPTNTMGALGYTNLNAQVASLGASGDVEIATNTNVCWYGQSFCASNNNSFGWYMNMPGTNEQIIYNPELVSQAITVNSTVPANNSPTSCSNNSDTGFTYVMNAMSGGAFNEVFLPPTQVNNPLVNSNAQYTDAKAIAMQTNATGSSFVTTNGSGISFLVYETNQVQSGNGANGNVLQGGTLGLNLPPNTAGHRVSWVELR
jgi:type IV pilus assembly protein PilY1